MLDGTCCHRLRTCERTCYPGMPAIWTCQLVTCVTYKRSIFCGNSTFARSASAKSCCLHAKRKARASLFHCTLPRVSPPMCTSVHARYYVAATDGGPHTNVQQKKSNDSKKKNRTNERQHTRLFRSRKLLLRSETEKASEKSTQLKKHGVFQGPASSEMWHRATF